MQENPHSSQRPLHEKYMIFRSQTVLAFSLTQTRLSIIEPFQHYQQIESVWNLEYC